ncbi:ComEC/Rec2 family competence protein [Malacoplasma muris]|uniref:ComEC/Rec2 family competence protein n=1 Tax=Malacoplasma muris TaxID=2119 RepID=UPI00398EE1C0
MKFYIDKMLEFIKNNLNIQLIVLSILCINLYFIDILSFLILPFFILAYSCLIKINKKTFALSFVLPVIIFGIYFLLNFLNKIMITEWVDLVLKYSLRKNLILHIDKYYDETVSSIIKMILFSYKDDNSHDVYNSLSRLSIVHLIVVSGFHISVYIGIINFIFKKHRIIKNVFLLIFLFFICYLNDFNLSIFRSLMFVILGFTKINRKHFLNISIILISLFVPNALTQYGFQMSCLCIFVINIFNKKIKGKSKFINYVILTALINLILLPYTSIFSNKISLLFFLYNYLFTPIFYILYLFISLFFLFEFMVIPISTFVNVFLNLVKLADSFNIFISLPNMNNLLSIIYMCTSLILLNYWKDIKYETNQLLMKEN